MDIGYCNILLQIKPNKNVFETQTKHKSKTHKTLVYYLVGVSIKLKIFVHC